MTCPLLKARDHSCAIHCHTPIPGVRPCLRDPGQCGVISLNPPTTHPSRYHYYHPYFEDEKTRALGIERIHLHHTGARWQSQDRQSRGPGGSFCRRAQATVLSTRCQSNAPCPSLPVLVWHVAKRTNFTLLCWFHTFYTLACTRHCAMHSPCISFPASRLGRFCNLPK